MLQKVLSKICLNHTTIHRVLENKIFITEANREYKTKKKKKLFKSFFISDFIDSTFSLTFDPHCHV